jgi:hypothetical protein
VSWTQKSYVPGGAFPTGVLGPWKLPWESAVSGIGIPAAGSGVGTVTQ